MLNMNINYVLDQNFSLLIGSNDCCVPWNKIRCSALLYDYYNIHNMSLLLYLQFTTANVQVVCRSTLLL